MFTWLQKFFPPFTFKETLKEFKENLKTVNFILTDFNFKRSKKKRKNNAWLWTMVITL